MTDIIERLRFDAVRSELQFSKGVAQNIEEAVAEIERLREELARSSERSAAADVIERVAKENHSDPACDDLTVPLAIQLAETHRAKCAAIESLRLCLDQRGDAERRATAAESRLDRIRAAAHKGSLIPAERLQDIRIILDDVSSPVTEKTDG